MPYPRVTCNFTNQWRSSGAGPCPSVLCIQAVCAWSVPLRVQSLVLNCTQAYTLPLQLVSLAHSCNELVSQQNYKQKPNTVAQPRCAGEQHTHKCTPAHTNQTGNRTANIIPKHPAQPHNIEQHVLVGVFGVDGLAIRINCACIMAWHCDHWRHATATRRSGHTDH
jgi:hypothetical protein